jgi:HAT1-interacting factor 1
VSLEDREESSEAMLKGILGQMIGQSPADQRAQLDKVTQGANDLSAFVKRKSGGNQPARRAESTQKRSAQEGDQDGDAKRPRFDSTSGSPS